MSKLSSNRKKYLITLLSVLLSLQNAFADIQGVWGNIVKINDIGAVSQRSMAGFRIDNSTSPFEINYLGSSNDSVQFNKIPNNFVTPDGAEHTFDNRFNNLFMNETNTTSGDVIEAQAFFQICPYQYGDKCVYFKIVSQHQDYGYYYAADAPKKHQLDFDGYIKNLTTGTGIGLGIGGSSIGLASLAYGTYKIIRHYRSKNSLYSEIDKLNNELVSHVYDIHSFENSSEYKSYHADLDEYNKLIDTHAKLKQDHLKMQKLLEENINIVNAYNQKQSANKEGANLEISKEETLKYKQAQRDIPGLQKAVSDIKYKHNTLASDKIEPLKKKLSTNDEIKTKVELHDQKTADINHKINTKLSHAEKTYGKGFSSAKFVGSSIATIGVIPIVMGYYGLLMGTRGTHQGLWGTDFMVYSLEPITQDDIKTYKFIPQEAINTHFEVIEDSTAAKSIRLGFSGDGIDNQPLVEISLSLLSNVWNPAIIRDV